MRFPQSIILLLAFAIVMHLACCDKVVEPVTAEQNIQVSVGEQFTISLEVISGTGYSWYFIEPFDSTVLALTDFRQVDYPDAEPLAGRPMLEVWTFLALSRGSTAIKLEYMQIFDSTSVTDTAEFWVNIL